MTRRKTPPKPQTALTRAASTEIATTAELSQQPRFSGDSDQFFFDVARWISMADLQAPQYQADSQKRDAWLSEFWRLEPHLAGVLSSVVSIDANRGWSLTGGRNQVMRYSKVLHNWLAAPGLYGWRPGAASASLSFYTSDLGGIVEIGREGAGGPLRGLYHTDPTVCKLTGNIDTPLAYKGKAWNNEDFLRLSSMPDVREKYNGLGYCFVSRALELATIMVAIFRHDQEQLGARAPRGLLLIRGINQDQWENAMQARKTELDADGYKYFNAVAVLASMQEIDAKLVALSQLPANFDLQKFTSLLMYGYALCAGYDPSEFYPVQFGSLGRGTEMEVQHQKATGKGGLNFVLALQEQLQRPDVLPETLEFEYEQRDDQGEIMEAGVQKAWVETFRAIRETGLQADGQGGVSREEYRTLLAEKGILPREWTDVEEDVEETDTGEARKRRTRDELLARPFIWRTLETFPDEPVLRYHWKVSGSKTEVLWQRAGDLLEPMTQRAAKPVARVKRQGADTVLFEDGEVVITEEDVDKAIEEGRRRLGAEYGSLLDNEPVEE